MRQADREIVQGLMRTSEAVGEAPGMGGVFAATLVLYLALGAAACAVLVQLGRAPMDERSPADGGQH